MNSLTKVIIGGVVGAAIGTLVVGLIATDEGKQTRKKLAKKARKLRNKTKQQMGELKVSVGRQYETVKQAASDLIDEGMDTVAHITSNAGNASSTGNIK